MIRIEIEKKKKEEIINKTSKNLIIQKINIKKKNTKKIEIIFTKKRNFQKTGNIYQIINLKKKINIKKKSVVVIKNMKEIEKRKDGQRIEDIIHIMAVQDILMINIKIKITHVENIKIIIEEINIQIIKTTNLEIVHYQSAIKTKVLLVLHPVQIHLVQDQVRIQMKRKGHKKILIFHQI